jgi:uncharacterized membrane protein
LFADIFRWWLVVQLLGLLALPLTIWFFRRLPDRGYSFAKPFGLLLVGYGAWLLSMLGLGAFGYAQLVVVALVVAVVGALLLRRDRVAVLGELRQRIGWIGFQELLFAAALFVGLWLRWHDLFGEGAGIRHTEQPMDLTFLSGILASQQFPPQDPWLSPYPINYYYLGYLLVAALIRLSGVGVGVGYTLGIATIFALAATGIAGLIYNLMSVTGEERTENKEQRTREQENKGTKEQGSQEPGTRNQEPRAEFPIPNTQYPTPDSQPPAPSAFAHVLFPLLAVVLVLIAGNQVGGLQLLAGSEKVVALPPAEAVAALANGLGSRDPITLPPTFPAGDFGGDPANPVLIPSDKIANFDGWWPSRAVWDDVPQADGTIQRLYTITEFPFFSFLLGDLHPHVLSLPWSLLAIAVAFNVLLRRSAPDFRARNGWLNVLLTAIVLGGLYAINSWDLPTYLLLYLGALTLLYGRLAPSPGAFFWPHFIQQAGITILTSYFVFLPFHMTFSAPTAPSPIGIAPARTGLWEFGVMFGLFALPLLVFVIGRAVQGLAAESNLSRRTLLPIAIGVLLALTVLGVAVGWPLLLLLPLAFWAIVTAYNERDRPATSFALLLFALGALIVWGCDLIFLRDNYASPRMNTIFKFYYQVWLIWGALAAYAVWALLRRFRASTLLWFAPWIVLLASALVYPALAPDDDSPPRTLDGLAYLRTEAPDEAAAIDWIRANTPPDAVVVQVTGQPYNSGTSRIASATGRPTILGWNQHERLWRRGQPTVADQIAEREADVLTLYTTLDPQLAQSILARYNARYVVVGPNEQQAIAEGGAPPEALTKFARWMQPVFQQGTITIYERVQ